MGGSGDCLDPLKWDATRNIQIFAAFSTQTLITQGCRAATPRTELEPLLAFMVFTPYYSLEDQTTSP